MIDVELKGYIERVLREGLAEDHFLTASWTLKQWREFYWRPQLFHQLKVAQWMSRRKGLLEEAWEKAEAMI